MMYSFLISVTLFLATACVQLASLRFCSGRMTSIPMQPHTRVLSIVTILFITHLLQIGLFAGGFWFAAEVLEVGTFEGADMDTSLDYLYFSAVIYTSLGIGDIVPKEHLRFLTGVEALNGLLLIAWSASFLFSTMNRLWDWKPCVKPDN